MHKHDTDSDPGEPTNGRRSSDSQASSVRQMGNPSTSPLAAPVADAMDRESITVLIVDEEKEVADANALRVQGRYDVRTAYGGREALETVDESVDVVVLDRRMSYSGDKVLKELRGQGYDCRVIMVTAVDPGYSSHDMPFDDYLCKPFEKGDLLAAIEYQARIITCERLSEYFELAAKRTVLETELDRCALEELEGYVELESRIQTHRTVLGGLLDRLDHFLQASDRAQSDSVVTLPEAA